MSLPDRSTFETAYAGQAPWDIGKPQRAFMDVAERVKGTILDAGCGTGDNALYFAGLGHDVTGIDFLAEPIKRARHKAASGHGSRAKFLIMDALELDEFGETVDSVIDCGLFHVFSDEGRRRYVKALATVVKPGGHAFVLCFSDAEPGDHGPRRVSRGEIETAFADGWTIESITPARFEVRPDLQDMSFSEGGPKAWFVIAQRAL